MFQWKWYNKFQRHAREFSPHIRRPSLTLRFVHTKYTNSRYRVLCAQNMPNFYSQQYNGAIEPIGVFCIPTCSPNIIICLPEQRSCRFRAPFFYFVFHSEKHIFNFPSECKICKTQTKHKCNSVCNGKSLGLSPTHSRLTHSTRVGV